MLRPFHLGMQRHTIREAACPEEMPGEVKRSFAILLATMLYLFPRTQVKGLGSAASADTRHNARAGYVGDDACRSCHADQFASHHQTAHYRTSMAPGHDSILGSFTSGDNILKTANPKLFFRMEEQRVDEKSEIFSDRRCRYAATRERALRAHCCCGGIRREGGRCELLRPLPPHTQ
jgi:hypothetical protein